MEIKGTYQNIEIYNCNIKNGQYGIYISGEPTNSSYINNIKIKNCDIKENYNGIYLKRVNNIEIYHNNFYNSNNHGVEANTSINREWSKNYPVCGNYWDDYTGIDSYHGPEQDLPYYDNIGDTPYGISGDASDKYPLINPWTGTSPIPTDRIIVDDDFNNTVYNYGIDHFREIQDAIDTVSTDATINVMKGTYAENIVINKKIKLIGENKNNTIIDGEKNDNTVLITADNVQIKNFTIKNAGGAKPNAGIKINSDDNTIYNNKIIECDDNGIYIQNAKSNTIQKNILECYDAIYIYDNSDDNTIIENIISNSEDTSGVDYGIFIDKNSDYNQIYENKISDFDKGIYIRDNSNENLIYNNDLVENLENAEDQCTNHWDQGNIIGGNYYSNYDEESEGAYDSNYDGKIDDPYNIAGGDNKDDYPLASFFDNKKPVAEANGPYKADKEEKITFDSSGSSDPDGTIENYTWSFGDGHIGYGKKPSHTYTKYGDFTVTLMVTDNQNLKNKDTAKVTIGTEQDDEEDTNLTETENKLPVADPNGPYYESIGIPITFDGSYSYDKDGTITKYEWTFGEGNTSKEKVTDHTYINPGNYTVTLTVEDDDGEENKTTTYAVITEKPNKQPLKPTINGTKKGTINIFYNYSANSTDPENKTIKYIFNWSDGTNDTNSSFLNSSTPFNTTHKFTKAGIYKIKVYAIDSANSSSEKTYLTVLIDACYCENLGYLLDTNNDKTYDIFYSNNSKNKTPVTKIGKDYYIDTDNDSYYDYTYNELEGTKEYQEKEDDDNPRLDMTLIGTIILIIVIIVIVLIIAIYIMKKPKKKKTKKPKEIKLEEKNTEDIDKTIDDFFKEKK